MVSNEKKWHVWRCTQGSGPYATSAASLDVVACGAQQARKLAAALWRVRYADVEATCASRGLPRVEAHGPRLAPVTLLARYAREAEAVERPRLVRRRPIDKAAVGH